MLVSKQREGLASEASSIQKGLCLHDSMTGTFLKTLKLYVDDLQHNYITIRKCCKHPSTCLATPVTPSHSLFLKLRP